MISLVKNELVKIFSKKSIYVILIIFLVMSTIGIALSKIIEKFYNDDSWNYSSLIELEEEHLKQIDKTTKDGKEEYAYTTANIEMLKLQKKYGMNSWQGQIIGNKLYDIINNLTLYKNGLSDMVGTEKTQEELQNEYNRIIELLDKGDWKYFAKEDLEIAKKQLEETEKSIKESKTKKETEQLNKQKEELNIKIQALEWRIEKDICYNDPSDTYLSQYENCGVQLIELRYNDSVTVENYKTIEKENINYDYRKEFESTLELYNISKYRIENNIFEAQDGNELRDELENNSVRFLFLIIISILIAGTIVSEEFNKGTIKLLLIRPYSRRKVLASKIIACFIMIIFSVVMLLIIDSLVNIIAYGVGDISSPIVMYNFNNNTVMKMSIFKYVFVIGIRMAPMIIILTLLAITVGVLLTNSAIAIVCALLVYMGTNIASSIAQGLGYKWLKFIPTLNWDFTQYLYGRLPTIEGMTVTFSLLMCILICATLLIISFEIFARKNIKNV